MRLETMVKKYRVLFRDKNPNVVLAHNDREHFYISPSNSKTYRSVSFFTNFIKDPSLSEYKKNRALEYIKKYWSPNRMDQVIEEARNAPEEIFQLAGDIGTKVHHWRQDFFDWWIKNERIKLEEAEIDGWPIPANLPLEGISACRAIKQFLKQTGYVPVACELALVDDVLEVGGQIDDLGIFPNIQKIEIKDEVMGQGYKLVAKPFLGFVDLKTSNQGKKVSYAYQVRGFYQRMIKKTFNVKPRKTYILHASKENGTFELIDLTDMDFLEKKINYLVYTAKTWDKVYEFFKPKTIKI